VEAGQECGDDPDARLFPHDRGWVLYNVKRLCREAKVPEVTAHGARGIHATIATQMGTTSHVVALALGHGSAEVTKRHYIRPGAAEQASRARLERKRPMNPGLRV
jgi:integrase